MKLNELEALAKAAAESGKRFDDGEGDESDWFVALRWRNSVQPQTILQMIALIRTMRRSFDAWPHHFMSVKAIEAYEEFEHGH